MHPLRGAKRKNKSVWSYGQQERRFLRGDFMAVFSTKILLFEACGHEKNEFSCSCGRGVGARVPTGCRRGAADAGGAVVVVLVQSKSKSYIDTLLVVHFEGCKCYFVPLYLCTEGRGRIEGRNGDGRTEGRRAAGARREAIPPPR